MKEIKSLITTKILIFPVDEIDFPAFRRKEFTNELNKQFKINYIPIPDNLSLPVNAIYFKDGEIIKDKKIFQILDLIIEERRIITKLSGPTKIIEFFINKLLKIMQDFDLRETKGKYKPLLEVDETALIVKMDFSFNEIIKNSPLAELHKKIKNKFNKYDSKYNVEPFSFKYRLSYFNLSEKFLKNNVNIGDKDFIIEQRAKTDPKDKLFFTASPLDSDTHLEILQQFEKIILDYGRL
ncbi:MAG: hypothetical protein RBT69_09790 [Spirochaetia bacterium]|jgi:hypothetical protein|nr:hypothetical protein [Spirochaetia bacterium]